MENSKRPCPSPEDLDAALLAALRAQLPGPLSSSTRIAVAFSGGIDSAVLLHVAHRLAQQHGFTLFAFHIHHGLQASADAWELQCRHTAQALSVSFDSERVDVDVRAGNGSLEAAARQARYIALTRLCEQHDVTLIATAHHADDQAETVLLNLMRGCGVAGIAGIAAHRRLGPAVLVRPFLEIPKTVLAEVARPFSVVGIDDPSNADQHFKRNAVRHTLLPLILQQAPAAVEHLRVTARHARDAQTLLDELGAMDLSESTREGFGPLLAHLRSLSRERAANALRWWFRLRGSNAPSAASLAQVLHQLLSAQSTSKLSVPCAGGELHVAEDRLVFTHAFTVPQHPIEVRWDGHSASIEVPQWHGQLRLVPSETGVPAATLAGGPLSVRPRVGRERLRQSFNRPAKTLKNLYQESGIAAWLRPRLPLVFQHDALMFAAGIGMDLSSSTARGDGAEPHYSLVWSLTDGFAQPYPPRADLIQTSE